MTGYLSSISSLKQKFTGVDIPVQSLQGLITKTDYNLKANRKSITLEHVSHK